MTVALIVAADEDDTIGRDGDLPWYLPEDLRRFKRLTLGQVVLAGRVTQDSIVARLGTPLPGRTTVVVSRSTGGPETPTLRYVQGIDTGIALAQRLPGQLFIIGGAQIYAAALPLITTIHLTRVHQRVGGDRRLPAGWLDGFGRTDREPHDGYTFETYQRL
jgi:dihydrofolate reductase